jgi:hypothetical protein
MAEGSEAFNIREMPAIQGGWRIEDGGGAILNSPATIRSQFAMTADPTITPVGSVSRSRSSIIPTCSASSDHPPWQGRLARDGKILRLDLRLD